MLTSLAIACTFISSCHFSLFSFLKTNIFIYLFNPNFYETSSEITALNATNGALKTLLKCMNKFKGFAFKKSYLKSYLITKINKSIHLMDEAFCSIEVAQDLLR